MVTFGERVRYEREARGLTQAEAAQAVGGIGRAAWSRWEANDNFPNDPALIVRIADTFMVSVDYLLGRTDDRGQTISKRETLYTDEDATPIRLPMEMEVALRRKADRSGQPFADYLTALIVECVNDQRAA